MNTNTYLFTGLFYLLFVSGTTKKDFITKRPNVLTIYTDDQGSIDLNCYGATDLQTPHIDHLAETGVKFTQFYSSAPVCSPSRASLMTGKSPQAAGLPGNASSRKGDPGMPTEQITIAEVFKSAGYQTAHIGKWHMGFTPETMPNGQGFDHSFGHMGGCIDNYSHFFYWKGPNRHDLWRNGKEIYKNGDFFGDLMVHEIKDWLKNINDKPFFMYWAINMPHYPYQGKEKWLNHYADLETPRQEYAAFVSTMDEMVGEIISYLEETGLRENTIIVFQSDQGHSEEERAFYGGGNPGLYRGEKFSLFEGGIRVPAIISWPGVIPEKKFSGEMAFNVDWLPTLAKFCEIETVPAGIIGKDISTVILSDTSSPHQQFVWKSGPEKFEQWAVRKGDWKLVHNPHTIRKEMDMWNTDLDTMFLVNLKEDVHEQLNLSAENAEKTAELEAIYHRWLNEEYALTEY